MGPFNKLANLASSFAGKPLCFGIAVACIFFWAISGPFFHFSETWQLIINTGTTIITFLMVFLIQNTQNKDMLVLQLKLDELIKASKADNKMLSAEDLDELDLQKLKEEYKKLAQ